MRKLHMRFENRGGAGGTVVGRDVAGLPVFAALCMAAAMLPWLLGVGPLVAVLLTLLALWLLASAIWAAANRPDESAGGGGAVSQR